MIVADDNPSIYCMFEKFCDFYLGKLWDIYMQVHRSPGASGPPGNTLQPAGTP